MGKVELWRQIAAHLETWYSSQSDAHLRESVDWLLVEYMVDYREKLRVQEEAAEKKRIMAQLTPGAKRVQRQREWATERAKAIFKLKEGGMTGPQIGNVFGISRNRVAQILWKEERHRRREARMQLEAAE